MNNIINEKMFLVLAAPSVHNVYYKEHFNQIIEFQINYAKKIIEEGTDEIYILVNTDTENLFIEKLPKEIILNQEN